MNIPFISDIDRFREICQPILSYLKKYGDPYTEVHISMNEIKVTSVKCGIPVEKTGD